MKVAKREIKKWNTDDHVAYYALIEARKEIL